MIFWYVWSSPFRWILLLFYVGRLHGEKISSIAKFKQNRPLHALVFISCPARSSPTANAFSWEVNWHSQTTKTRQPSLFSAFWVRLSRSTFPFSFSTQYCALLLGIAFLLQPLCWCQKQPCTNMAALYFGNTISGQPGRSFLYNLNRNPRR